MCGCCSFGQIGDSIIKEAVEDPVDIINRFPNIGRTILNIGCGGNFTVV